MAETKVKRIKATDDAPQQKPAKKPVKPKSSKSKKSHKEMPKWLAVLTAPFRAIGRYVAGAAEELKQTRWPNRKATWGLTIAVLIFSAFFAVIILLLDYGFEQLLQLVIGIQGE